MNINTGTYLALRHPDEPENWLYCSRCGSRMQWAVVVGRTFRRDTGAPYSERKYQCPKDPDHDSVTEGATIISEMWSEGQLLAKQYAESVKTLTTRVCP